MPTLAPTQIGLVMAAVGWMPPMGYVQHQDGTLTFDAAVKAKAVAFFDRAISVCLAESGGDTLAKNSGSSASGLWQIMVSVHGVTIQQQAEWIQGELHLTKKPTVFHPLVNTAVAHTLWGKSGWKPWESSKDSWAKHTGHGAKVYAYLTSPKVLAHQDDLLTSNLISDAVYADAATFVLPGSSLINNDLVTDPMGSLLDFARKAGIPVGVFILGLILLILGAVYLIGRSKTGKAAVKLIP